MNKYNKISSKEKYDELLASGMFWEIFPELSGEYDKDVLKMHYTIGINPYDNTRFSKGSLFHPIKDEDGPNNFKSKIPHI